MVTVYVKGAMIMIMKMLGKSMEAGLQPMHQGGQGGIKVDAWPQRGRGEWGRCGWGRRGWGRMGGRN